VASEQWSCNFRRPHEESKLQRYRRLYPELELDDIKGDDLSVLFAMGPDPALSLRYFRSVSASMSSGKPRDAGKQLIDLLTNQPHTFRGSGWVKTAVGRLVLENEAVAKEFLKQYWSETRKKPPKARTAAFEALAQTEAPHRQHWLAATRWMKGFREREDKPKEADWRFVERAVKAYRNRGVVPQHSCLPDNALKAIATTVIEDSGCQVHVLTDRALARLHAISPSTLAHLRAKRKSAQT
jgi:hypothetical protein